MLFRSQAIEAIRKTIKFYDAELRKRHRGKDEDLFENDLTEDLREVVGILAYTRGVMKWGRVLRYVRCYVQANGNRLLDLMQYEESMRRHNK